MLMKQHGLVKFESRWMLGLLGLFAGGALVLRGRPHKTCIAKHTSSMIIRLRLMLVDNFLVVTS